jgi:hypothetical protein
MLLTKHERKRIIGKLQEITNENGIIDFLRKNLRYEYATVFNKELEEENKIAKNNRPNKTKDDKDINLFMLRKLRTDISQKLDVRSDYMETKELLVIIFFEKLIARFDKSDEKNIEKNNKIEKNQSIYLFFRGLIANGICNLSKYNKAKGLTGFKTLTQEDLNNDKYHDFHGSIARKIADDYLIPFIDEYKNYL